MRSTWRWLQDTDWWRARGGGLGIGGIVVILMVCWITGINPLTLLSEGGVELPGTQQETAGGTPANDETTAFVRTVLAETEDTWNAVFKANGADYQEPALVLFLKQVQSACGFASSASGPFYCPQDRKVYPDTISFRQLDQQFDAAGDFAEAYVVAHEVGHHVQNILSVLPRFNGARKRMSEVEANQMSVRVELQANCFPVSGASPPIRRGCWKGAISKKLSMLLGRLATTRCRSVARATSCPNRSITELRSSAWPGSSVASTLVT